MFGKKKMYKKGLADAMSAYQDFGTKQEEALAAIREEVRKGKKQLEDALSGLGEEMVGIYQYLDAKEKAALYHLNTPYDIKTLEESEQRLLVAVLYQLAEDEGNRLNDDQRTYIHGVQRYLGISNPQVGLDDLSVVGDIDSGSAQKAILQTVLEFFYLQEGDEITDNQEEFLSNFSVNKKQATAIESTVSRLFNAVGAKGLAEKYGNDEVIQQADEQQKAGLENFKKHISGSRMHVPSYSMAALTYHRDFSTMARGASIDDECYKDQNSCRREAQRQLERRYQEIKKQMSAYTKRYGDDSCYKRMCDRLDASIQDLRKQLSEIRNPKTASIVGEIEKRLTKTKVTDNAANICDRLADKYHISEVSHYYSEIEYDVYDPSEFASSFLEKMFMQKTYGYSIFSAVSSMEKDGLEQIDEFAAELADQFNDLIDRHIIDPIQDLISDLQEVLYNPDEAK